MRKMIFVLLVFISILLIFFGATFWCYREPLIHLKNLAVGETLDEIKLGVLTPGSHLRAKQDVAIKKSGMYAILFNYNGSDQEITFAQFKQLNGRFKIAIRDHIVSNQDALKLDGFLYEKNSTKIKSGFTQSFFLNSGDVVSITIDLSNRSESEFEVELRSSPSP